MKQDKIAICVHDGNTKNVIDQVDKKIPDIFNVYDVCDLCNEQTECEDCIVNTLQHETYISKHN